MNPREEIVALMRGFFACPLLRTLGLRGLLDRFLEGPFSVASFPEVRNREVFGFTLEYLVSLGLLAPVGENPELFQPTTLGAKVFRRYGSFLLLHSYRDMIENMEELLFACRADVPRCDRHENVIGSGLTNGRKFFPKAIDMMRSLDLRLVADIACGNGDFLRRVIREFPGVRVIASDLSEVAINETARNLGEVVADAPLLSIQTDASNVSSWAPAIAEKSRESGGDTVISMWYLIHEISRSDPAVIVQFLRDIRDACPAAHLIIGEIVNTRGEVLALNRYGSIMPEFLLFHSISGQGVLTWEQFQHVLSEIPYHLEHQATFDHMVDGSRQHPTGIVWHLVPKED